MAKSKRSVGMVDEVVEELFNEMHSSSIIVELTRQGITDYERGIIAGKIEMIQIIANRINPIEVSEDEVNFIR